LNKKIIGVFAVVLIILITLSLISLNFILPIKTVMISGDVGHYKNGDILFFTESDSYNINDFILYEPSSSASIFVAKIIEKNTDDTFKVISTNPESIENLDQNNLKKEQIIGKVISSMSPYIFSFILIAINLVLAFIITHFIYKRINKSTK